MSQNGKYSKHTFPAFEGETMETQSSCESQSEETCPPEPCKDDEPSAPSCDDGMKKKAKRIKPDPDAICHIPKTCREVIDEMKTIPPRRDPKGYIRQLEKNYFSLQTAICDLSAHFARVQSRLQKVFDANPDCQRKMFCDLERYAFEEFPVCCCCEQADVPRIRKDPRAFCPPKCRQKCMIKMIQKKLGFLCDDGMKVQDECGGNGDGNGKKSGKKSNIMDMCAVENFI